MQNNDALKFITEYSFKLTPYIEAYLEKQKDKANLIGNTPIRSFRKVY
jgi:hypothetical protein